MPATSPALATETDKRGDGAEIAIPHGRSEDTCPVVALQAWLTAAQINAGPLSRKVNRGGVIETTRLAADGVRHILLNRSSPQRPCQ